MNAHETIYLKDYQAPAYWIDTVDLVFDLQQAAATVTATLQCRRNQAMATDDTPLILEGEKLQLKSIDLDGRALSNTEYQVNQKQLTILKVPQQFVLKTIVEIHPQTNTELCGLYRSKQIFCTQCEAQGFRRITYYLDRPDVMAKFTTTIYADKRHYPVLLSNGNLVEQGQEGQSRHWAKWEDPFLKPCYLFALVAGDLVSMTDHFVTQSNRLVKLQIYTAFKDQNQCQHAMLALKKAMRWDETTYGREYDLDQYMIVAVDDFNMGAMENKGLNIFNAKYILANAQTATDSNYQSIDAVVAHEYFHNWTGNRITCRDWFQLSLKEGLTVFREHHFCADMHDAAVQRIEQVADLRANQFPEDSSAMSHPVQPQSYVEINNFYTSTVYEKGAELIRVLKNLIGWEAFKRGMDHYFTTHDGCAATIEDFIHSMEVGSNQDLKAFSLWYKQSGTPTLQVEEHYEPSTQNYTLNLKQQCAPTKDQPNKKPLLMPVFMGLLDSKGQDLLPAHTQVVLKEEAQSFSFESIPERPVLSILRAFSAPVKLQFEQSLDDLAFLLAHDSDDFNRWEAGQRLSQRIIEDLVLDFEAGRPLSLNATWLNAHAAVLNDTELSPGLKSTILSLPSLSYLLEFRTPANIDALSEVRRFMKKQFALQLKDALLKNYQQHYKREPYVFSAAAAGERRFRDLCLSYLLQSADPMALDLCVQQWNQSSSMSDTMGVLNALCDSSDQLRDQLLAEFYQKWRLEPLVLDKYFRAQALSDLPDTLERVKKLMKDPAFDIKNPNKVYSLIGAFSANLSRFHDVSGAGYQFVADAILRLDPLNPQVAAYIAEAFVSWQRFDTVRQAKMKIELMRLHKATLSPNVAEIISKCLLF